MKRGVMGKNIFFIVISVFLLSGVFAALPDSGKCIVNTRAECTGKDYHVAMGLSGITSAHGEVAPGSYSYVLCCAFGTGITTCNGMNAIVKLSAPSNAHAEIPARSSYTSPVCYEDLNCVSTSVMSTCPTEFPLQTVSLTSFMNAHIGAFADYTLKICCASAIAQRSTCKINTSVWAIPGGDVIDGQNVEMRVTGSSIADCDGALVKFDVQGGDHSKIIQPMSVPFSGAVAIGVWKAQHQAGALGIGDVSYRFNASIFFNPTESKLSNTLTVRSNTIPPGTINTCSDYTVAGQCNADVENVADESSPSSEIDCYSDAVICSCVWNQTKCDFSYSRIDDPLVCDSGETKCYSAETETYYCYPGATCPPGDTPYCNHDTICDSTEGCTCSDCEGKQDTCKLGLTCSGGKCGGDIPSLTHTKCSSGLCTEVAGDGINECIPVQATCSLPSTNHSVCVGQSCFLASGSGSSECSNSAGCSGQPAGHTVCSGGTCSEVSGDGISQCAPVAGSCSIPPANHAICVGNSCFLASGSGSSECTTNGQCAGTIIPGLTHTVCSSGLCTEVAGDGVNQCLPVAATCSVPSTSHSVCVGQSCFLAIGSGSDICANSGDCSDEPAEHTSCIGGTCSKVTGAGTNVCAPIAGSCSTPTTSHSVCVGESCVIISGSGSNECSDDNGCGAPVTTCTVDEDCGEGRICIAGTCHFPIHTCNNVTCPVGQYCRDGTCGVNGTTTCTTDLNCPSGYECIAGFCFNPVDTCTGVICPSPSVCIAGTCINDNGSIINDGCGYGYTLCNAVGLFYCYPGDHCPSGQTPGNNNGNCEFGYDGCTSADCKNSDVDTCLPGLYCIDGECSSVVLPVTLNLTNCRITQTITKDCNTEPIGYKTIVWKGTWIGTSTTGASYLRCITGGTDNVPCPAEIQLPFFDYMEMIASLIVITVIYVSLVLKGKLKRKK